MPAVFVIDDRLSIPLDLRGLEEFRRWAQSAELPGSARVDWLAGSVEVELGPEDLYTHGAVKSAIAAELHDLVVRTRRGSVFIDRTRVSAPGAELSVEPDVVVVLWESLERGAVREVPRAGRADDEARFAELEGAPDLVVEIAGDGSERKDRERLPALYARAGVRELWLVDARSAALRFDMLRLDSGAYGPIAPDPSGWVSSSVLGVRVRLRRDRGPRGRWSYELEVATG